MKSLLLAILLIPSLAFAQELATYSIDMRLEGMTVPGQKVGVGDRNILFQIALDPEDLEAANDVWYAHLGILLGPDEIEALRAWSQDVIRRAPAQR